MIVYIRDRNGNNQKAVNAYEWKYFNDNNNKSSFKIYGRLDLDVYEGGTIIVPTPDKGNPHVSIIDTVTPDIKGGNTAIKSESVISLFDRDVIWDDDYSGSYADVLGAIIDDNFGANQDDTYFRIPWISHDFHTEADCIQPETDETGLFNFRDWLEDLESGGVVVLSAYPTDAGVTIMDIGDTADIHSLSGYGWTAGQCANWADILEKQYHREVNKLDLGQMQWVYDSEVKAFKVDRAADMKVVYDNMTYPQFSCRKYATTYYTYIYNHQETSDDLFITIDHTGKLFVRDFSTEDAGEFKTSVEGVILYYEITSHEITDISDMLAGITSQILFDSSEFTLDSETYSRKVVSKITTHIPDEEDDEIIVDTDYYLFKDGTFDTDPTHGERVIGDWAHISKTSNEVVNISAEFAKNSYEHKIVFYANSWVRASGSLIYCRMNDGRIVATRITGIEIDSKTDRIKYSCGNLKTTLAEIIQELINKE